MYLFMIILMYNCIQIYQCIDVLNICINLIKIVILLNYDLYFVIIV